jgi:hypothetical protein
MKTRLIKTLTSSLLFAGALFSMIPVLATFGPPSTARAQTTTTTSTCSLATLDATYVFATHGWNIVNGAAVPKAIVELITFNGNGTLVSPFATVSINGSIIHSTSGTGTYTLQSNCTGTITFTNGPMFDIVVDPPSGDRLSKRLWMIQTGPTAVPAVFEGTAERVSR